jgi:hypothetical protein
VTTSTLFEQLSLSLRRPNTSFPNFFSMNTTEQRIDDQDKSIDYSEPFLGLGEKDWSTDGGLKKYMNTASLTHKKGASAKLTFTGEIILP